MQYKPEIYHRRSIRLRGYDYAQAGLYFITLCTHERRPLFGEVVGADMQLNAAGMMVETGWQELANKYPGIQLHEYVTMPNHLHGIIEIVGAPLVGAQSGICINGWAATWAAPTGDRKTIGDIVGAFKSLTTNAYIRGVKNNDWHPFNDKLWQRNYYEHIIRNDESYLKIAEYIHNNPLQWQDDVYHV